MNNVRLKKHNVFLRFYAIYTAVLIIIIIAALAVFYRYIEVYELSRPEHTAEAFKNNIDDGQWTKLISDSFSGSVTKYENAGDVTKYILGTLDVSGLKCSKNITEYTSDVPVYNISAADKVLLKITLSQSGKSGFGFPVWDVSDVILRRENIAPELREISLTVPDGSDIFLGGVAADEKYITGKTGGLSEFEASPDSNVLYSVWKIGGLYMTPEIKVEYAGAALEYTAAGDGFFCDYPSDMRLSYTITVPSGASVAVNGIAAGDEYITKSGIPYTYSAFESGLTKLPYAVTYTIDGLLRKPEVSVEFNGEALTDSGGYIYDYPESRKYSVSLEVPQGASAYLNSVLLSGEYIKEDNKSRVDLSAFSAYLTSYPLFTRYYADGLYVKPEIKVMYNGDELQAYDYTENAYTLSLKYDRKTSGKQKEQYSPEALSFAKDYIYYMARGKSETTVNAGKVLAHILADTDAYKIIEISQDSVKFITPYEEIVYNSIEVTDFIGYTDECFTCKVVFDVSLINYGVAMNYAGVYELLYIIKDGIPYVADITITGKN